MKKLLTIAGSDCSGGAGIQADLRVFQNLGSYGMSVITAVTAQNTFGVRDIYPIPPEHVAAQLEAITSDIVVDGVKCGMLVNAAIIRVIADSMRENNWPNLVIDPVIRSSSGHALLDDPGLRELTSELLPQAFVVTPNITEAEILSGEPVRCLSDMKTAAQKIARLGVRNVIIKGGHLEGDSIDLLYDGRDFFELGAIRMNKRHTHGTGCIFSSALTTSLAAGQKIQEAFGSAKEYTRRAIEGGLDFLGGGIGPAYL